MCAVTAVQYQYDIIILLHIMAHCSTMAAADYYYACQLKTS